jgi:beta-phosphoglucomutase
VSAELAAIVFDFDGVIANTEPLHCMAFRDVLADAGVTLTDVEYYTRYLGYDDLGVFRAIGVDRGLGWDVDRIEAFADRKAERFDALEREVGVLFPGAADAIRRAAAEVPVAIASGALRAEIVRVLEHAGVARHFAAIVAAEDTPAGKPAPDPYLRAIDLLSRAAGRGIPPNRCVAIEDSRWGLAAAQSAGLRTVAVCTTYSATDLTGIADLLIPGLVDFDLQAIRNLIAGLPADSSNPLN